MCVLMFCCLTSSLESISMQISDLRLPTKMNSKKSLKSKGNVDRYEES